MRKICENLNICFVYRFITRSQKGLKQISSKSIPVIFNHASPKMSGKTYYFCLLRNIKRSKRKPKRHTIKLTRNIWPTNRRLMMRVMEENPGLFSKIVLPEHPFKRRTCHSLTIIFLSIICLY